MKRRRFILWVQYDTPTRMLMRPAFRFDIGGANTTMKRLKDALGDAVEKMVDRATEAGNPPPAHFVVKMKELGLLRPDNERPITRDSLEEDNDE